jgi:precorrin-4/cobalt-precorrin-4 C11-methyltransferase
MTLPGVLKVMKEAEKGGKSTVRLHTGDSSIYGAVREQMDALQGEGIPFEVVPGVSSFCGAAAAMKAEYTLPGVSQTVIITRKAGRTPVPGEESVAKLAAHGATMVIFLSAGMTKELQEELLAGGYPADTPAAIVYKATWPDEKIFYCTIGNLHQTAQENGIRKTALITVGGFLGGRYKKSRLYDASFTHEYRKGSR